MSALVGFAGAISAVAIAIGEYATEAIGISTKVIAIAAILAVSFVHWFGVKTGGRMQTLLTSLKLSLIVFFLWLHSLLPLKANLLYIFYHNQAIGI
jgi:basic amino acid/polyamine antiporter, APA family